MVFSQDAGGGGGVAGEGVFALPQERLSLSQSNGNADSSNFRLKGTEMQRLGQWLQKTVLGKGSLVHKEGGIEENMAKKTNSNQNEKASLNVLSSNLKICPVGHEETEYV